MLVIKIKLTLEKSIAAEGNCTLSLDGLYECFISPIFGTWYFWELCYRQTIELQLILQNENFIV